MKVQNYSQSAIQNAKTNASAESKKMSSPQGKEKEIIEDKGFTRVALSEQSQKMGQAESIAKSTVTDQPEKVSRLQKLIDSGQYRVDSEAVADRLLDQHLLFPD